MSENSFARSALTGRLANTILEEILLAILAIAVMTGISLWKLDGVWLYIFPGVAIVYSAVRIFLVARRNAKNDQS